MTPRAGSRRLVALLWLSAVWLLLSCVPALAHARLVQEEPTDGAALAESPDRVKLRFSEPVDAQFSPLEVRNSEGERVDEDNARVDPHDARVVIVDLKELPEDSYRVEWRVTSIDGHVVDGRYGFAVTAGADQTDEPVNASRAAGGDSQDAGPQPESRGGPTAQDASAAITDGAQLVPLVLVVLVPLAWMLLRRR
jgi:methionine-rich copper-binding protein CopC